MHLETDSPKQHTVPKNSFTFPLQRLHFSVPGPKKILYKHKQTRTSMSCWRLTFTCCELCKNKHIVTNSDRTKNNIKNLIVITYGRAWFPLMPKYSVCLMCQEMYVWFLTNLFSNLAKRNLCLSVLLLAWILMMLLYPVFVAFSSGYEVCPIPPHSSPGPVVWQIVDDATPAGMPARKPETGAHYR